PAVARDGSRWPVAAAVPDGSPLRHPVGLGMGSRRSVRARPRPGVSLLQSVIAMGLRRLVAAQLLVQFPSLLHRGRPGSAPAAPLWAFMIRKPCTANAQDRPSGSRKG